MSNLLSPIKAELGRLHSMSGPVWVTRQLESKSNHCLSLDDIVLGQATHLKPINWPKEANQRTFSSSCDLGTCRKSYPEQRMISRSWSWRRNGSGSIIDVFGAWKGNEWDGFANDRNNVRMIERRVEHTGLMHAWKKMHGTWKKSYASELLKYKERPTD